MTLYAGADAGQASTTLVIGDERGEIVARTIGDGCFAGDGRTLAERVAFFDDMIAQALADMREPPGSRIAVLVAGVSGVDEPVDLPGSRCCAAVKLVHDTDVAQAGAFADGAGITVIAGSGSVAIGVDGARRVRVGGWGFAFGDEGSAFWIGRETVAAAMRAADAAQHDNPLKEMVLATLRLGDLRAVQHGFADGTLSRAQIAEVARPLLAQAQRGRGGPAAAIAQRALAHLSVVAREAAARLGGGGELAVSYAGGLFADPWFAREFAASVAAPLHVVAPRLPPEAGALLLAYRAAGLPVVPRELVA